jgi:secreted trypsin-like serine protease
VRNRLTARRGALLVCAAISLGAAAPASAQERIVGGTAVPDGKYPFMTSLRSASGSHFCGGTLVAPGWVLTASHCVSGRSTSQVSVVVGRTTLSGTGGHARSVTQIVMHPEYGRPVQYAHDAALLRLSSDVTGITPIRVADAADDGYEAPGNSLTTAGWGTTRSNGFCCPDRMNEVEVPAVSDASCASSYGGSLHAVSMLCAGQRGKDSCQGDSGGPLFESTTAGYVQLGTVSWGRGCGSKGYPGVYGELNYAVIRDWVRATAGV